VLYFNGPDIHAGYETLKSRGVEFTGDYELWLAFFRDSDGNMMAIMDERGELST